MWSMMNINSYYRLDSSNISAFHNRALVKYELKDFTGSNQDYVKSLKLNPNYPLTYFSMGIIKMDLKDFHGAIKDFSKAIEIDETHQEKYFTDIGASFNRSETYLQRSLAYKAVGDNLNSDNDKTKYDSLKN